jgi:hypothetical protein
VKVQKSFLKNKVESFIYNKLTEDFYEISELNSTKLLTWNRFIISFNLLYLDLKDKNQKLADKIYYELIRSTSLGTFIESDFEKEKNSIVRFLYEFDKTFNDINTNGFDIEKSIIPLAYDGSILNGAHRSAISIFLNKNVNIIQTNLSPINDDYNSLYKRDVKTKLLDLATIKFIEYSENIFVAFLWPSCDKIVNQTHFFNKIVSIKKLKLTENGAFNLIYELYRHMDDWVGKPETNFLGIQDKFIQCFPNGDFQVKVIVFQSDSLESVKKLKDKIRVKCNIGYSSIHITDTKDEALSISRLIFNNNGIHFLNFSNTLKYHNLIKHNSEEIKNYAYNNGLCSEDIIIDSGALLCLYGIRKNSDVDFIVIHDEKDLTNSNLDFHDSELIYHGLEKEELIYNPEYHFIYDGLKYISFKQLFHMKKNRSDTKDKNDLRLMAQFLNDNSDLINFTKIKQRFFYFKIRSISKLKIYVFKILRLTSLYKPVRFIYRSFKDE